MGFSDVLVKFVQYMDSFEIVQGKGVFTNLPFQAVSIVVFLSSLYFVSVWMEKRPAFELKKFSIFHNFLCSFMSLITLLGLSYGLTRLEMKHHYYLNMCAPRGTRLKGALYFWCYVYFIQKWYDLVDSYLIILKKSKKGLTFLQVYHHAVMLMLTNGIFASGFTPVWLACFLNSIVHFVMYAYYGFSCLGMRWKNRHYITILQLIQFGIVAMVFIIFIPARLFFNANCAGNLLMSSVCAFSDGIFLIHFVSFYINTYRKKKSGPGKKDKDPTIVVATAVNGSVEDNTDANSIVTKGAVATCYSPCTSAALPSDSSSTGDGAEGNKKTK